MIPNFEPNQEMCKLAKKIIGMIFFAKELDTPRPDLNQMLHFGQLKARGARVDVDSLVARLRGQEVLGAQPVGLGGPVYDRLFHLALGFYKRYPIALGQFMKNPKDILETAKKGIQEIQQGVILALQDN